MNFNLSVWHKYRTQAGVFGSHIQSYKDDKGIIHMDRDSLKVYISHITTILKECSDYMDKCGLTAAPTLWKYDIDDPTTQPSSVAFKYKDRMTKKAIRAYGEGFMNKPLEDNVA